MTKDHVEIRRERDRRKVTQFRRFEIAGFSEMVDAGAKLEEFRCDLEATLQRLVDLGIGVEHQREKVASLTPVETLVLMAALSSRQHPSANSLMDLLEAVAAMRAAWTTGEF